MAEDDCSVYDNEWSCSVDRENYDTLLCIWENEECIAAEPFGNSFNGYGFNKTCMVLIVIFVVLFFYKEEIMKNKMIQKILK